MAAVPEIVSGVAGLDMDGVTLQRDDRVLRRRGGRHPRRSFRRGNDLLVSIRGGGHNGPGLALCDDGLVIDLSRLKGVRVDPAARTVRVAGGCTWGRCGSRHARLWPRGSHRHHFHNRRRRPDAGRRPRLPGAPVRPDHRQPAGGGRGAGRRPVRDGGRRTRTKTCSGRCAAAAGNFGVVTSFLFRRTSGGHRLRGGDAVAAGARGRCAALVSRFPSGGATRPQRLLRVSGRAYGSPIPRAAAPQADVRRRLVLPRPLDNAETVFRPVRAFGPPAFEFLVPMPFPMLQSMFDPLLPPGLQWYWKGDFVNEIGDEAIAVHLKYGLRLPTTLSTMHLCPVNGAVHDVGESETAFSYRGAT